MLRRALITGLIAGTIGVLSKPVSARSFINNIECTGIIPCIEKGNMVYTYNKIGIPVSYSKELAADLKSIVGIDAKVIVQRMYGTEFSMIKKPTKSKKWVWYVRVSNDSRDHLLRWYVKI